LERRGLLFLDFPASLVASFPHIWYYLADMEIIDAVLPALPYVQITLAILLTASILLQQRGSSLGGAFGGDNFSSAFHKRRGAELFLFKFTIGISILFVVATFLNILA
jgi:protein translocase SecG subunit